MQFGKCQGNTCGGREEEEEEEDREREREREREEEVIAMGAIQEISRFCTLPQSILRLHARCWNLRSNT